MPSEHFIQMGKRKVHYYQYGSGSKTIIGLHGWPGAGTDFARIKVPEGWKLIAPDLPGCGSSEPLGQRHTVSAYAGWLEAFTEALGIISCVVESICGTSPIAIKFANRRQKVKALIFHYFPFIHPGLITWKSKLPLVGYAGNSMLGKAILNILRSSNWYMERNFIQGLPQEAAVSGNIDIHNKRVANLDAATDFFHSLMHTDLRQDWKSLNMPILILAAENDHSINQRKAYPLAKRPNVILAIITSAHHYWDNNYVAAQNAELEDFLDSLA